MNKIAIMVMVGLIAVCSFGAENVQSIYNAADDAAAIRIKYNGDSATATVSNGAVALVLVDDTVTTNIAIDPAATWSTIMGYIQAATNSSGVRNYQVEYVNAIAGDLASNIVAFSNVDLSDGKWHEICKFDTSACLFYSSASYGDGLGQRTLKSIFGDIKGTGDVTYKVYVDGAEKFSHYVQSPVLSIMGIGSITNACYTNAVVSGVIDINPGIWVGPEDVVTVRGTRATTATTGGIGASFEARK